MKPETKKKLLDKKGVVGVIEGKKRKGGKKTNQDAIIVFVDKKLPLDQVADPVPPMIDGVPTDVIQAGDIQAQGWGEIKPRETVERFRPALGGCSVAHYASTAGTLGVVAMWRGQKVIFSNNHVLGQSNAARRGDFILQPGPYDGGVEADVIALLEAFIPLKFDGSPNYADAAFAVPVDPAELALGIMRKSPNDIVIPTGFHQFAVDDVGWKRARTTDHTVLKCLFVGATLKVGYGPGKTAVIEGCEIFDPPGASAGGDSGSVIMFGDRMGSHLFAGSDQVTVGTPVRLAFELLGLTIAEPDVEEPPEEPPEPEPPPDEPGPIEPVELLTIYLGGKVQVKHTIFVENGKIVVR